jgi:5-methylcytosine-specific restriction endonuclease McrA
VIPYSKGGKTSLDNLELVCRKYNESKGNRPAKELIAA